MQERYTLTIYGETKLGGQVAKRPTSQDKTKVIIALIITGVWAFSFIASVIPWFGYKPDPGIHGMMLIVAGGFFGSGIIGRDK